VAWVRAGAWGTHLPGEWIDIGGMTDSTEWECNIHTDYIEVQEHGLTPPLAVLKALFRTLEAKETAGCPHRGRADEHREQHGSPDP
jgi:hypothetical protein